jgi:hypothetical protein
MLGKTGKHVVALAILMVASAALMVASAADMTVGQFVQDLARAKKLNATDPQVAVDSLTAAGVRLPAGLDLSATLTEGDVTKISRAAGLKVRATDPSATFSAEQAELFFGSFAGDLSTGSGIGTRAIPGTCVVDPDGSCAQQGADCLRNGRPGFCMTTTVDGLPACNCNTGKALGKRKQVVSPDEPE